MESIQPFIDTEGRLWRLYSVAFTSDGRSYSFELPALSEYHAMLRLEDIRNSAQVDGEIIAKGPARDLNQ